MEKEEIILNVNLRAFAEMLIEILRNEGVDAVIKPGDSLTSALGSDKGNKDWMIIVPGDCADKAREILAELEKVGEHPD